jgi:hypothetical protein
VGRRVAGEEGVAALPALRVVRDLGEGRVVEAQQAGLGEVGHSDAPAALQVGVDAIGEDLAQGRVSEVALVELGGRHPGVRLQRESQGVEHGLGQPVVGQPLLPRRRQSPVQGAAYLADQGEVVEVAGLEAGVLPVVDEGEEFACPLRQVGLVAQGAHDAGTDQGDGGAAAFRGEGAQLGEVLEPQLLVRGAAVQTEAERGGDPPGTQAQTGLGSPAVRADPHLLGKIAGPGLQDR